MELGEKIKKLRRSKNLTQEELGEKLNISRVAISKWETGRGYPNIDSLLLLAKIFDVSVDSLLSTEEVITIAKEEIINEKDSTCSKIIALFNFMPLSLLFLPFFRSLGENEVFCSVFLFQSKSTSTLSLIFYFISIFASIGVAFTVLFWNAFTLKEKVLLSILSLSFLVLVFALTLQPYPATLAICLIVSELLFLFFERK